MSSKLLVTIVAVTFQALLAGTATAVPTIDGTVDAEYGAPLSIQNTNTHFGDATNGDPINGGKGSELDAIYAKVSGDRLYVVATGNLETNFNKLEIFFDSKSGGVNTINGLQLPRAVDPFSAGGFAPPNGGNADNKGALQWLDGLTFDAGFNADYYLTIMHGFEDNIDGAGLRMYAATAHYANLSNGPTTVGQALGMQLAPRGLPNVLRGSGADADVDGDVDGPDFLTWQRNQGVSTGASRLIGDATGNGSVDGDDLAVWKADYGFNHATASFHANYFAPQTLGVDKSDVLLGPELMGLSQGELIDRAYAMAHPGLAPELQFALPVTTADNPENHRDMLNTVVDLRMAIDNSNTGGVSGNGPYETPTADNPAAVKTGVEFSIPLSQIGNPTGAIKLLVFVNGQFHDFASNQVSGTGFLTGNFGGLMPDFEFEAPGNQYVTISNPATVNGIAAPEPATAALLGIALAAGLGHLGRRRS